ncbi:MAG: replication factor C large subunit [Candidatus Aenigmatarchaeota archaeon]
MWVEKYKPKKLSEIVNQEEAKKTILKWFEDWRPGKKPILIYGPPGSGKSCTIEALANEKGYDFIEMNASDFRSSLQIKEVIGKSAMQKSLFKKGKIFFLDEIEGLYGKEDFGGVKEIIELIKTSYHRIILACNNPYEQKLRSLREYCIMVEFKKIHVYDIERRLKLICEKEGIKVGGEVLRIIAKNSDGDLRSAINDLEIVARGRKEVSIKDLEAIGYREKETSIFDALKIIFKTQSILAAKLSINNVDKSPEEIFWWIENNVSKEYESPEEVAKSFDILSKADIFQQRIASRQNWRFMAYMIDLMTGGVATAKDKVYKKFTKYQYPSKILLLGSSKIERTEEKDSLKKLSTILHCSTRKVRKEFLPYLKLIQKTEI